MAKGLCGHPQRLQRAQLSDQIHAPLAGLHQLHRVVLGQRVVKDDPLQPRQPGRVPILRIGFQDDPVRPFVWEGEAFHQLIRARAPRASALDNSPTLLPPAEFAIELAIADMHEDKLGQAPPSGSGNTKRTVCGSMISRRDPGLKFQ